ncbi:hypothetical protein chiPu_0012580 [Chiloscyllium punctatum]|uniref:Uncharacterized protein n=1 Tax=Chiloscyllium punctatum TaxID=137246 RepID=A0A401SUM4_CHIPU|nr:hypothetical protein [Chiloscyllium punctatum]
MGLVTSKHEKDQPAPGTRKPFPSETDGPCPFGPSKKHRSAMPAVKQSRNLARHYQLMNGVSGVCIDSRDDDWHLLNQAQAHVMHLIENKNWKMTIKEQELPREEVERGLSQNKPDTEERSGHGNISQSNRRPWWQQSRYQSEAANIKDVKKPR